MSASSIVLLIIFGLINVPYVFGDINGESEEQWCRSPGIEAFAMVGDKGEEFVAYGDTFWYFTRGQPFVKNGKKHGKGKIFSAHYIDSSYICGSSDKINAKYLVVVSDFV